MQMATLTRVVRVTPVTLELTVIPVLLEQVPPRVVLVGRVIPAAMAIQEVLVLMVLLVLTATQEAQPLLSVTQII